MSDRREVKEVGFETMEDVESVSDSELDLNRDVFDDSPGVKIARRGLKYWGTVVRRSSIGWFGSTSPANHKDRTIQPDKIIDLLRTPSVQAFTTLKKKLIKAKNYPEWILEFLNKDGLGLLFESLEQLCNRPTADFLNCILQVSCVECVRTIMDTSLGLDFIVDNKEFTEKIAKALDTDNVTLKKQLFELLAALCVYSKDGYARVLDSIECYKVAKRHKYRFFFLVDELRHGEPLQYKTAILECINCLIIYTDRINDRVRIRNEFYGLKLQEILNQLRKVAEKDSNLETQLDVFDEHRANDDEQLPGAKGIDLTSALDVFHAIFKQVSDTPQEIHFLTVLQNLLKIDNSEKTADVIWEAVESLVSKATVIESAGDSRKLLLSFTKRLESDSAPHKEEGGERRRLMSPPRRKLTTTGVQTDSSEEKPPPVPPRVTSPPNTPVSSVSVPPRVTSPPNTPVSSVSVSVLPPPPPPPPMAAGAPPVPPPPPLGDGFAPPPPPPPPGGASGGIMGFLKKSPAKLPQQNIPKPKTKMRTLQWQKIPANKVVGKSNIWTMTGKLFNGYVAQMDYDQIENLFSVNKPKPTEDLTDSSGGFEKKKKENTEVNILDGKRSLNVNIFLRQFKMSNEEIVQLLQEGKSDKIGAEKLRSLQKILPSQEEIDLFRSFDGDQSKLGSAEKFFMCLMSLPNYRLRVEGLLIKEEFTSNMDYIRPSIDSVIEAAKDIKENKNLHELLYLVLLSGNYINAGNYAGDAAGFKLSSLLKLTETRANKPRMNLMHYVVLQAEEKNPSLLTFTEDMKFLNNAAQVSLDNMVNDIRALDEKVVKIKSNIDSVGSDFKRQMKGFIEVADKEMSELKEDLKDIESLRLELADFFCEDEKTFKLEECFKIFQAFCERFNKAQKENHQRKEHEAKMEARRLQREAEAQTKIAADQPSSEEEKGSIVEMLLADVRSGFKKHGDPNFSVTKVHKVNIDGPNISMDQLANADDPLSSFIRGGTGRRSLRSRRNRDSVGGENSLTVPGDRNSYAVDTDGTLFDVLMQPDPVSDKVGSLPEGNFSRMGSLKRRRSDRMQQRTTKYDLDRERAPSPNIEAQKKETEIKQRPKSDVLDDNFDYRQGSSVRRSRSMYDRTSSDNLRRLDTNNNKSESDLTIERSQSPAFRLDDPHRRSSRWRSEISEISGLPKIDEKGDSKDSATSVKKGSKDDSALGQRARGRLEQRLSSNNLSQEQIQRVLDTAEDVKKKTDEHSNISLSVRTKLNKRWHSELDKTDIDNVLKAIEETGKQIDEIGKSEKPKETVTASVKPEVDSSISKTVKAPIDNKVVPQGDGGEPEQLKVKRNQRKKRSTLSMDDIHAAFKKIDSDSKPNDEKIEKPLTPPPKSPIVPPRRSKTGSSEKVENEKDEKSPAEREQMSKAAKLAGKKRFFDQRFGGKETPSQKAMYEHSQGRWKSDVEKENVDEAIRDYMSKNNMSRSKSYDEAVARKAISESDISIEIRKSLNKDGRRNGHVWTDDESDTETMTQGSITPRRPSSTASTRSDSPKSSGSRLSVKSLNNSTETLRETGTDGENSPEQKRKESVVSNISDSSKYRDSSTPSPSFSNRLSDGKDVARSSTPPIIQHVIAEVNQDGLRQYEKRKPFDEDDDLPVAQMLKWRKKRDEKRRQSFYDNVPNIESGNLSPKGHTETFRFDGTIISPRSETSTHGLQIFHKQQGSNELQNEIGSRCSYASSSDSASRDEGFETMSGTVSQRTSLSSTLESEFLAPFAKKAEAMSKLQINENIIAAGARASVNDTKKQRTESWTEAVAINAGNINSDDSIEYSVTSPDSGNETMKDDVWADQSDLESTLKNDSRPMSPLSTSSGPVKKEKKVPSYMRGTTSSSKRRHDSNTEAEQSPGRKDSTGSSTVSRPPSRLSKGQAGLSSQSLNKSKAGSNTSIVSITSNASDISTSQVKKRVSQGGKGERPQSVHLSTPSTRSVTPVSPVPRSQTPSAHRVAHKPAAHPMSTVGGRTSTSTPNKTTTKTKQAPPPPSGRQKTTTPSKTSTTPTRPASTTPTRPASTTPTRSTTTPSRSSLGTPRSTTPNPIRNRSTTPTIRSATPSFRPTTPSIDELSEDPNAPSPLKRTQSLRMPAGKRPSFMSPTASSKARIDIVKAEDGTPPPTPPPRRSKDTDALPQPGDASPSPLKRHSSLRLPGRNANKTGKDQEKSGDNKLKGFIQKIGGSGSKVRPETEATGKLAPVAEGSEKEGNTDDSAGGKEGGKSPSLRKILGLKAKDKSVRKSTDSLKSDTSERKRKGSK